MTVVVSSTGRPREEAIVWDRSTSGSFLSRDQRKSIMFVLLLFHLIPTCVRRIQIITDLCAGFIIFGKMRQFFIEHTLKLK